MPEKVDIKTDLAEAMRELDRLSARVEKLAAKLAEQYDAEEEAKPIVICDDGTAAIAEKQRVGRRDRK